MPRRCCLAVLMMTLATLVTPPARAEERRARNVVLFVADAGGIPTISAASLHGHGEPRRLFVQQMPHVALAETSSATRWVTDSAAAMTAMATGHKTHNGVLSQSSAAVRGKKDGQPLKTILEHAEERGLSTGVVSNSHMDSATPAALYAHVNDRGKRREIFAQILAPRFGDGVDVVLGPGRKEIMAEAHKAGIDLPGGLARRGYAVADGLAGVSKDARRIVALVDSSSKMDLGQATERAIAALSRNPKGFFLMVESDLHAHRPARALDRAVELDNIIRRTAGRLGPDTLIIFTADHSYDFRLLEGKRGAPVVPGEGEGGVLRRVAKLFDDDDENVRAGDAHTGEEVLVTAQGPGAERVRGFLSNTDIFHVMMAAYGWDTVAARER